MKVLFSGIQPSGVLHIGNYLGAIKQWVELQNDYEAFFCVVDLHAITVPQDPEELHKNTLSTAALYLAAGIDPKKSTIFVQSHVPAHAELAWILNTMTPLGELERMTQFKDKTKVSQEEMKDWYENEVTQEFLKRKPTEFERQQVTEMAESIMQSHKERKASAGLFIYPVLMVADILLYQTDVVPVGEDQKQHIELARLLAKRFNNRFGLTFKIPQGFIPKETARIMGLDDPSKKMSKSAGQANYVALLDPPDVIRKKIKAAVTDSGKDIGYDEGKKPAISNLIRIYSAFSGFSHSTIVTRYRGKGYSEFKKDLGEILIDKLAPIQKRYRDFARDRKSIVRILEDGAKRANAVAKKTLRDAKAKVGLLSLD